MTDLNQIAGRAMMSAKTLMSEIEGAEKDVRDLGEILGKAQSQLDSDWERLRDQTTDLIGIGGQEWESLLAEATEAQQAVAQLEAAMVAARGPIESEIGKTVAEFEEIEGRATAVGPKVEEAARQLEETARSLKAKIEHLQTELDELSDETAELLTGDFSTALDEIESAVQGEVTELEEFIENECLPKILSEVESIGTELDGFATDIENDLTEAGDKIESDITEALHTCQKQYEEHVEKLLGAAKELKEALDKLGELMENGGSKVGDGMGLVADGASAANSGLETAVDLLEELKEFYSRFSFAHG